MREGQQAPGTEIGVDFIGPPGVPWFLNENGRVVFSSSLIGPGVTTANDKGFWMGSASGAPQLIVRKGDNVPGMAPGVIFTDIDGDAFNDNDLLAFRGKMAGPAVTAFNDEGVWLGGAGGLDLVVSTGDPAPGLPVGTVFRSSFGRTALNNAGTLLVGGRTSGITGGGLWIGTKGALSLLVATGTPAPETEPGTTFGYFLKYVINGNGDVALLAHVNGPNVPTHGSYGIWGGTPGALKLIARGGMPVSTTDPSRHLYNLQHSTLFLNDKSDVAFNGYISGYEGGSGVWVRHKDGDLSKVAMMGDVIEVNEGDYRTVYVADLANQGRQSGNQDGLRSGLSDAGLLVFRVGFDDSTGGIFLADTRAATIVEIDVRPGNDENIINLKSHGVVTVAVLSSADFDATMVVPSTILLGGCGVKATGGKSYLSHWEDVNDDGFLDLVAKVAMPGMQIDDSLEVTLTAETMAGEQIVGTDLVRVVHTD